MLGFRVEDKVQCRFIAYKSKVVAVIHGCHCWTPIHYCKDVFLLRG